jgi:H+/gluconate symporter-like permease
MAAAVLTVRPLLDFIGDPVVALLFAVREDRGRRQPVGAGSLFFSHVNDAGFWLVKEYFGLTVGQTIKTWSVMETIISIMGLGLGLTLLLSAFF